MCGLLMDADFRDMKHVGGVTSQDVTATFSDSASDTD